MIRKEHEFYESPVVMIQETSAEGILCASSPEHEGWKEDDLDW
jgi:hypothetical protein